MDNSESVFENFVPAGQYVVRQKKKVRLVHRVRCGHVEFRSGRREADLPERLLDQALF